MEINNVCTMDGRIDGIPHHNELEKKLSEKRYTFHINDFPDFFKDKKVLDIGCGWGAGTKKIADLGAEEVNAFDMNPDGIKIAREENSADNITYHYMHIDGWNFHEKYWDVVVAVELVEHLTDEELDEHLDNIHKALKDDGKLYISTPHMRGKKEDYPRGSHFTEYLPEELKEIVEDHGFTQTWYRPKTDTGDTGFAVIFEK